MYVKVCGITCSEDAEAAIAAGADALGINLVQSSKRYVEPTLARALVEACASRARCVLVVAHRSLDELRALLAEIGPVGLQLHGDEPDAFLGSLGAASFKALRVGGPGDFEAVRADSRPLLVDAKVGSELGGTGQAWDWSLVAPLAALRPLILAGGLTPDNVAHAVRSVRPWAVDVASGVESAGDPRRKDPERLRRFVKAAREASAAAGPSRFAHVSWPHAE